MPEQSQYPFPSGMTVNDTITGLVGGKTANIPIVALLALAGPGGGILTFNAGVEGTNFLSGANPFTILDSHGNPTSVLNRVIWAALDSGFIFPSGFELLDANTAIHFIGGIDITRFQTMSMAYV